MSEPLLTPRQQELIDLARGLATRFAARAERHDREASFPFEDFADLHREGYLTLALPADLGGRDLSLYEHCLIQEELARGSGPTALGANMHLYNLGGGFSLFRESFRRRVAAAIAADGAVLASSISEPGASLGSPTVVARKVEGGYRVSGRKYFCTLAPVLRWFLFNARLEGFDRPGLSGTVTLAAERGSEGMRVIETWDAMGMRATGSHDIEFTDVFVPDECLVGAEGAGFEGGLQSLPWYALGIASVYLGIAGAAFDFTVDYVKRRKLHPQPRPIAHLPGIQLDVAEMSIALEAARAFVRKTAYDLARGADFGEELLPRVTAPQYVATRTALDVVTRAMQTIGGPSLFRRLPIERLYRDVRAGTLHPYTHSWLLEMIGKLRLGIPLDVEPRWG
jgi:alkylation response protein AidB-like acyl-CoA dehydrogenase